MKRSGISTLCGAIVLCTISTAAMAAADSRRGVGHAASGPMFDLPAGMNVSQQETHISLYAVRLISVFNSATHQTVHVSFDLPALPVAANPDVAAPGKNSDRQRHVAGKCGSDRVDLDGRRILKKKK